MHTREEVKATRSIGAVRHLQHQCARPSSPHGVVTAGLIHCCWGDAEGAARARRAAGATAAARPRPRRRRRRRASPAATSAPRRTTNSTWARRAPLPGEAEARAPPQVHKWQTCAPPRLSSVPRRAQRPTRRVRADDAVRAPAGEDIPVRRAPPPPAQDADDATTAATTTRRRRERPPRTRATASRRRGRAPAEMTWRSTSRQGRGRPGPPFPPIPTVPTRLYNHGASSS